MFNYEFYFSLRFTYKLHMLKYASIFDVMKTISNANYAIPTRIPKILAVYVPEWIHFLALH